MKTFDVKIKFDDAATNDSALAFAQGEMTDSSDHVSGYVFGTDSVYRVNSITGDVVVDDIRHYPLARSQEELTKTIVWEFSQDSVLNNIDEVIDIATATCNSLSDASGYIVMVKLIDAKFGSRNRLVLGTKFKDSHYVTRVASVVSGNAENGIALAESNGLNNLLDVSAYLPDFDGITM